MDSNFRNCVFRGWSQLLIIYFVLSVSQVQGQSTNWWNPVQHSFPVIEGQAFVGTLEAPFDRLPQSAKNQVREAVWNLSRESAGMMIRFRTNASSISVRYMVSSDFAMNHMPATGVSGVDLYSISNDGDWMWCRGRREFSDTVRYHFGQLKPGDGYHRRGREYRLYLPLYNQVNWLEIGVEDTSYFEPLPVRMEKPIVVYGTSIAQGACASRPGMAWTNILGRIVDLPVINLAFSGNGRLEPEVVDYIAQIDAQLFILDCLPNLTNPDLYPDKEVIQRVSQTVNAIRMRWPDVPILLTEHAGYTDELTNEKRALSYRRVNAAQQFAYTDLIRAGSRHIYYLPHHEIGLTLDDMVDGTHPNDLGMQHYAEAYEEKVRQILHMEVGTFATTRPRTQFREPDNYDWEKRHRSILKGNTINPPKKIILSNSIIHFWGGEPFGQMQRESATWDEYLTPMGVKNYSYGWDRIENVLWRVYHGELDGFQAEKIMVMIGTNNLHLNSDEEILSGLKLLTQAIGARQPKAEILLMGLLPRRGYESRIVSLNHKIAQLAGQLKVVYNDLGQVLLQANGNIDEHLFSDGLHPNKEGYLLMRRGLVAMLK